MKSNLNFIFLLILVAFVVGPFNTALALVVHTPISEGTANANNFGDLNRIDVLAFGYSVSYGTRISETNMSGNMTINENVSNRGIQELTFISTFLNVVGLTERYTLTPIPSFVLLFGLGVMGLIGIARRTLFTT